MTVASDALRRSLCARVNDERRTEDELRVLDDILAGIERGAEIIGPMNLISDQRDFGEEGAQECRDLLVYLAMQKVAEAHRRREWIAAMDTPSAPNLNGEFDLEEETKPKVDVFDTHAAEPSPERTQEASSAGEPTAGSVGRTFCEGGEMETRRPLRPVPNNGQPECSAEAPPVSVGLAGSSPAPDTSLGAIKNGSRQIPPVSNRSNAVGEIPSRSVRSSPPADAREAGTSSARLVVAADNPPGDISPRIGLHESRFSCLHCGTPLDLAGRTRCNPCAAGLPTSHAAFDITDGVVREIGKPVLDVGGVLFEVEDIK